MSGELAPQQLRALAWIRDFPCTSSTWSDRWDSISLAGPEGSIKISSADWNGIWPLLEMAKDRRRIYALSEAGHAALAPPPKEA